MKLKKVKFIETVIQKSKSYASGQTVDLPENDANHWVKKGYAVELEN